MAIEVGFSRPSIREEPRPANRLLMVSNRGPIEHVAGADGRALRRSTDGGVATALTAIAESIDVDWIACAATEADAALARRGQRVKLGRGSRLSYAAPPPEAFDLFYNAFCNPLLWFLQHGLWDELEAPNLNLKAMHSWQLGYLPVNQSVAEMVSEALRGRIDRVMFHDYHFYMAPLFVRNYHPTATLQHFIHIPWPGPEEWEHLPRKLTESICRGLLANDSVTFQTGDSVDNFLATCHEFLPDIRIDFRDGLVRSRERETRVWANAISVDAVDLHRRLLTREAACLSAEISREAGEKTILRVDRLDPAKNVLGGFQAYEMLLEAHPEWRERVRFLAFLVPTRTSIKDYSDYEDRVLQTVARINARFGSADWEPISVMHEQNRLKALAAMRFYDVLLVNSLADGMNLVSKEGPAINERNGVLVLSKTAGSYAELGDGALGVDPRDMPATAHALHRALSMQPAERQSRARRLRGYILGHQINHWLSRQMGDIGIASEAPVRPVPEVDLSLPAGTGVAV